MQENTKRKAKAVPNPVVTGRDYAVYEQVVDVIAAQSTLNTWMPSVQSNGELSLSQLWIAGDLVDGFVTKDTQTIEIGYQVLPILYGDNNPHLFIYYTADGYRDTGCYNQDCPGFVQTSNILDLGGTIPGSTLGGNQIEGTIAFYRDPSTGNWILFYVDSAGNYIQSGFYNASIFGSGQLSQHGDFIQFGGEVTKTDDAIHTTTDMGSGAFPNAGYSNAAYQRNLKYMDLNGVVRAVTSTDVRVTNSNCYTLTEGTNPSWGTSFYFGGPGFNGASCQ